MCIWLYMMDWVMIVVRIVVADENACRKYAWNSAVST